MRCCVSNMGGATVGSVTAYTLLGDVKFLHFLFFRSFTGGQGGANSSIIMAEGIEGNKMGEWPL